MKRMTNRLPLSIALGVLIAGSAVTPEAAQRLENVADVEVNNNALSNAGCYVLSDSRRPFFSTAVIFAANINGENANRPEIFFNPQVRQLLDRTKQVQELQAKGIRVVITLLGNHQSAGWSGMNDPAAAGEFADRIADMLLQYKLDGVDIDDEYSRYSKKFPESAAMIAHALTSNPKFRGKTLSKALFQDGDVFRAQYHGNGLSRFLSYGAEMTYGYANANARLTPYLDYGMQKPRLLIGVRAQDGATAGSLTNDVKNNGFGGVMVYNVTADMAPFLSSIARIETGDTVSVTPGCLR
jgi:hypothetical protein